MKLSYLFDAGWLFFALWAAILVALNCAAFAGDLFPSRPLSGSNPDHPRSTSASRRMAG
ncbi:MAG TPA: hypothetical protein VEJ00_08580 [Candidatus Acidoferrales bacterium]|nr:hypothetical protein [Candidatus Acidoferrales bacterium]